MAMDTRERILDVAERLFGERGFPATPLRDITTEAGGQRRVGELPLRLEGGAAGGGAREASEAHQRTPPGAARRRGGAGRGRTSGARSRHPGVPVAPVSQPARVGATRAGTSCGWSAGSTAETNEEFRATFVKQFDAVLERFTAALHRARPELDEADLSWRMLFMVGSMAFTMSWGPELLARGRGGGRDPEDVLESLVLYAAAGMAAPAPLGVPAVATAAR